jgi:hypothetical protein
MVQAPMFALGLIGSDVRPVHSSKQACLMLRAGAVSKGPNGEHRCAQAIWRTQSGSSSQVANASQQHDVQSVFPSTGPQVFPLGRATTEEGHDALQLLATQ